MGILQFKKRVVVKWPSRKAKVSHDLFEEVESGGDNAARKIGKARPFTPFLCNKLPKILRFRKALETRFVATKA